MLRVSASLNEEENLIAAPDNEQDPDVIGVSRNALSVLSYRWVIHRTN